MELWAEHSGVLLGEISFWGEFGAAGRLGESYVRHLLFESTGGALDGVEGIQELHRLLPSERTRTPPHRRPTSAASFYLPVAAAPAIAAFLLFLFLHLLPSLRISLA
ncbi:hypothetical protein HPP92_017944 [Vanilla planifolia]|uniref:Uncharacterized protein n=1 Tax=Vanilla planifolia TaxID=51239 RepID=A0A835UKW1_VANPL|nr:hypothetical protein HPP92_018523 [Vanilla planifolia]KAG0466944.1 hypothetical protein HPP92_018524 [Vanilla planifolia]KAG0468616.1 hypothetical protein HPP92_017944 [Vanilla planifolia]